MEDPIIIDSSTCSRTTWTAAEIDDNDSSNGSSSNNRSFAFDPNQSIDFTTTNDDNSNNDSNMKSISKLNGASSAGDTVSTAGDSASWGSTCEYAFCDYDDSDNSELDDSTSTSTKLPLHRANSEASLTLEDLRIIFAEDQVDPERAPPPTMRTDFAGDSQHSFTLDDLALGGGLLFGDDEHCGDGEDMSYFRTKQQPKKKKKAPPPVLKGILKHTNSNNNQDDGVIRSRNNNTKDSRRCSNLTVLPDSSFIHDNTNNNNNFNNGSLEGFDFGEDDLLEEDTSNSNSNSKHNMQSSQGNGWALMQQSFSADNYNWGAFDLEALLLEDDDDELESVVQQQKGVTFASVRIHYHACVVGDNPTVSDGVPLALAWEALDSETFASLEAYEEQQVQQQVKKSPPRFQRQPLQSQQLQRQRQMARTAPRRWDAEERLFLLLAAGVTLPEIQQAERLANRTRAEREATKQQHLLLMSNTNSNTNSNTTTHPYSYCPGAGGSNSTTIAGSNGIGGTTTSSTTTIAFWRALQEEDDAQDYDCRSSE